MKFLISGLVLVIVSLPMLLTAKAQQIGTVELKGQITVDSKEAEDKFYTLNNNFGCILPSFDANGKTFISARVISKLSFSNVLAIENNGDQSANISGYDYTIFANQKMENETISENKARSDKNFEAVSIPAKNMVNIPKNGSETGENIVQSGDIKKSFATNTVLSYQVGISGAVKGDSVLKLKADPKIKLECGVVFSYLFSSQEIGGFAWEDVNSNGVQDAGEPPILEVEVGLYDEKCQNYLGKTVTDTAGYYKFGKLESKKYCLKLNPNPKYTPTKKVGTVGDNNNSKLDSEWKIVVETANLEYDFGLIQSKTTAVAKNNSTTSISSNTSTTTSATLQVCEECELALATSKKPIELPRTGGLAYYQWLGIAAALALVLGLVITKTHTNKSRELAIIKKN